MIKKHHIYLIKKGIRTFFENPVLLYYKLKNFRQRLKKYFILNPHDIKLTSATVINLDFNPEIIIPIYNGYEYLKKLIEQLLSHTHINYILIIINDCSTDKQVVTYLELLKNIVSNHKIIIINNSVNLGFVKSVNIGMSFTSNHFIILNSDTEVPIYFANKILQPIIANKMVASVTPFTNSGSICSFPKFCQDNEIFLKLGVEQIDSSFSSIDTIKHNLEIPTAVGFCMAINKNVYKKIGGFDDELFGKGYGEENDWCMRAFKKGYHHVLAANCFVYHKHGGSFSIEQKQILIQENYKKLKAKHPDYEKMIHQFCARDELKKLRYFLTLKTITDNIDTICIFNTIFTGGAKEYLNNLIQEELKLNRAILLIEALDFESTVNIKIFYNDFCLQLQTKDIFILLHKLNIKLLLINHLLFNNNLHNIVNKISSLQKRTDAKLNIVIHDYFYLCPSLNLLGYDNVYCTLPNDTKCNKCLNSFNNTSIGWSYVDIYRNNFNQIEKWRNNLFQLLNSAHSIIVPSEVAKNLYVKIFPHLEEKIIIKEHSLKYLEKIDAQLLYKPFANDTITIATIGNIDKHKGSNILIEMINKSNIYNYKIKWVIIGYFNGLRKKSLKNLIIHNHYKSNQLSLIVNKYQVDIFIIASIWPETFCYAASEMMHFNLPVVSFDIGAHAIRIKQYPYGHIVPNISAQEMLDEIFLIKNNYQSCIKS
ncbi:MAG TPA: glycosyltransferase [Burkholderiales bacterium]|nr:glycosyltransferase [Burkholderiales bacterium]